LADVTRERERYLEDLDTCGPRFPREANEAWKIVQGLCCTVPVQ